MKMKTALIYLCIGAIIIPDTLSAHTQTPLPQIKKNAIDNVIGDIDETEQEMNIDTIDTILIITTVLALTATVGYIIYRRYYRTPAKPEAMKKPVPPQNTQKTDTKKVNPQIEELKKSNREKCDLPKFMQSK